MTEALILYLSLAILVVSFLYSCVGHAGASGYIAVMALCGLAPEMIKPTALTLNIFVASIASWQFYRAGHFRWNLFWPFALLAVPFAYLGGYFNLPTTYFKILVGFILLFSAWRFFISLKADQPTRYPSIYVSIPIGACLGLLAGLTGTGGGIFLTPLLLLMGWASVKQAAGVSALFILANSIAGLSGNIASTSQIPPFVFILILVAIIGGTLGSYLGSKRFNPIMIRRILAIVLVIAGSKLILQSI